MENDGSLAARQRLRDEMKQRRRELPAPQRRLIGQRIAQRLWQLGPVQAARSLMAFAPMGDEIDLEPFMEQWTADGRQLYLPRINAAKQLEAVAFHSWEQCAASKFGVREPVGPAVDPRALPVIIVPGLAFDPQGYRIGYGRAYYDRFLAPLPPTIFKCGIGYEFQIVPQTWPQPHDARLDWILTEQSEIAVDLEFF